MKPEPANAARKPAIVRTKPPKPAPSQTTTARPSAIVAARRPGKRYADVPEVSEEEHRRVGDRADAMMQELKRTSRRRSGRDGAAVKKVHPNHPTLRNPEFARSVFNSASQPKAWLNVARRLRSSADAIFDRKDPVAASFWSESRRRVDLATEGNPSSNDWDETKFPHPNYDAAHMLMAFAIENLLKGLAVAKGLVVFSKQELPTVLAKHDLQPLHHLSKPRAIANQAVLGQLTHMSTWRGRYPLPTSVDDIWPMGDDGTMKAGWWGWPDFNQQIKAYYDALDAELQERCA